ncbi:MAG: hypothetical protein R3C39_16265 [Dehalococcoidia bacterium]
MRPRSSFASSNVIRRVLRAHAAGAPLLALGLHLVGGVEWGSTASSVVWGWAFGALGLYVLVIWRRFVARALEGYPGEVPTGGVVVTGSVSSRVVLDFDAGTAEKAYGAGTPVVRWLYRLCFQAPFPYTANEAALETALHRRRVVGLLTKYWFGEDIVAPVLELRRLEGGRFALVTALVRGDAPRNLAGARALLTQLTQRFLESGLPVWQVADYNPRAVGNLIELPDGTFSMIDLESNLVTPFLPPRAIVRALRLGQFPSFDDVDVPRLRAYLKTHAAELETCLGTAQANALRAEVELLGEAQARWFASEPRWLPKLLRFAFRLIDVPSWIRGVQRLAGRGTSMGEGFVEEGLRTWVEEGHIDEAQSRDLERALANPEVALVLANLGAHLAITVPLRFPFGSLTRFAWTLGSRLAAEWRALRGRASAATARRVHTIPVMFATLLPSVGSAAYLLATPLRQNGVLEVITLDSALRRLPFGLHRRFHLVALMAWLATPKQAPAHWEHWSGLRAGLVSRLRVLGGLPRWYWVLLGANQLLLLAGAFWFYVLDRASPFEERGPVATLAAVQLLAASWCGISAYRSFWPASASRGRQERAGIFLWGISGMGLLAFAIDDYLTVHEHIGRWMVDHTHLWTPLTRNVDDFITLAYGVVGLAVLHLFRHEVMLHRSSSVLYLFGVVAAASMLLIDAYGRWLISVAEFPAQLLAVGLLFLAHLQRLREVRALNRSAPALVGGAAPQVSSAAEVQLTR